MTKSFDNNVICDQSGFKARRSACRMQWNNLFVRADFYERKHPELTFKPKKEKIRVAISRPDSPEVGIDPAALAQQMNNE